MIHLNVESQDSDDGSSSRTWNVLVVCFITVTVLPVFLVEYLPLLDLSNHLARVYILHDLLNDPSSSFRNQYDINFAPIPNVAFDVTMLGLMKVLSPLAAAKVFVTATILVWCAGLLALSSALGNKRNLLVLPGFLLALNGPFLYGLVNYSFGMGLGLIALAIWIRFYEQPSFRRWIGAVACTLLVYLSHLAPYVIIAVAAASVVLFRIACERKVTRRDLAALSILCAPCVPFIMFLDSGGSVGTIAWNSIPGKMISAVSFTRSYNVFLDLAVLAVLAVSFGATLLYQQNVANLPSRDAMVMLASTTLFFFVSPLEAFTASAVDVRIPPAIAAIALCGVGVRSASKYSRLLIAGITVTLLVRHSHVIAEWHKFDEEITAAVELQNEIPYHARVLPLVNAASGLDEQKKSLMFSYTHFYSVISRKTYVPLLFALRSQQPLVQKEWPYLSTGHGELFLEHRNKFDYVWSYLPSNAQAIQLSACCSLVRSSGDFSLWKIHK